MPYIGDHNDEFRYPTKICNVHSPGERRKSGYHEP